MPNVVTRITRVDTALIERIRAFSTATVHEAFGRRGALDPGIKPVSPEMKLCGPAVTVRCHPGDNLMLLKAIDVAQPGDVLVADMGLADEGPWGELTTMAAKIRHLGGLVMNASVRDVDIVRASGFPVFCAGVSVKGTVKSALGTINHPITCGGVAINPGDLVLGDENGVVVVPRTEVEKVADQAEARERKEASYKEGLRRGESLFEMIGLDAVWKRLGGTTDVDEGGK